MFLIKTIFTAYDSANQ